MYLNVEENGLIRKVSDRFSVLMGLSKKELVGKPITDFLTDHSVEVFNKVLPSQIRNTYQIELEFIGKSDDTILCIGNIIPLYSDTKDCELLIHIADIAEGGPASPFMRKKATELAEIAGWQYDINKNRIIWTEEINLILEAETGAFSTPMEMINYFRPDDQYELSQAFNDCVENGVPFDLDVRIVVADGNEKWVQIRGLPEVRGDEVIRVDGIIRDITGSKRLENILLKNNVFLKTMFEVGKSISRSTNKWTLSSEISQIIMSETGFEWVWFSLKPEEGEYISDNNQSVGDHLMVNLFELNHLESEGPAKEAVDQTKAQILQNIEHYDGSQNWKKRALENGFRSFVSLPFFYADKLYGTLNIYSSKQDQFDSEQLYFLNRIGSDFGYAIYNLELRSQKETLNDFNELLVSSLNAVSFDAIFPKNELRISGAISDYFGSNEHVIAISDFVESIHPNDQLLFRTQMEKGELQNDYFDRELRIKNPRGKYHYINLIGKIYRSEEGKMERMTGISLNIKEKKDAEADQLKAEIKGQDNERKRISTELHDGLGQTLTVAKMNLNALIKKMDRLDTESQPLLEMAYEMVQRAQIESREISHALMPSALVDFGLARSLESDIKKMKQSSDIEFNFYHNLKNRRFDFSIESNVYNIFREALNNIIKHSQATRANINLIIRKEFLELHIEDDGIGLENGPKETEGIGMKNIFNRVRSLKGEIFLDSESGTSITVLIYLKNR